MSTTTPSATIDKLPSTNSNAYRTAIRQYLADAVEIDDQPNATEAERIAHLLSRFEAEAGWNIARQGQQGAAREWLQGLAINIEYMEDAIPAVVLGLHGIDGGQMSPRLERVVVQGYWEHLAAHVVRLRQAAKASE